MGDALNNLIKESSEAMERFMKDIMLRYGLTLSDVRIIKYPHPDNKEWVVDMKNQVVRIERVMTVHEMQPKITVREIEVPVEDELFKKIVEVDKPKFAWKKGAKDSWYVPYNSLYNIVEIEYREGRAFGSWKVDVIGVMSENFSGFGIGDVDAVKKLAETKVFEALGKINDIIKRSNG